jgi:hypothetical protein
MKLNRQIVHQRLLNAFREVQSDTLVTSSVLRKKSGPSDAHQRTLNAFREVESETLDPGSRESGPSDSHQRC